MGGWWWWWCLESPVRRMGKFCIEHRMVQGKAHGLMLRAGSDYCYAPSLARGVAKVSRQHSRLFTPTLLSQSWSSGWLDSGWPLFKESSRQSKTKACPNSWQNATLMPFFLLPETKGCDGNKGAVMGLWPSENERVRNLLLCLLWRMVANIQTLVWFFFFPQWSIKTSFPLFMEGNEGATTWQTLSSNCVTALHPAPSISSVDVSQASQKRCGCLCVSSPGPVKALRSTKYRLFVFIRNLSSRIYRIYTDAQKGQDGQYPCKRWIAYVWW